MKGCVALIPARGGSQRVPGKNTRLLNGVPLIAYTVAAAQESKAFQRIVVSSDDPGTLSIARRCGSDTILRPDEISTSTSPDIEWIKHALDVLGTDTAFEEFAILRPTSPFRSAAMINRAFELWNGRKGEGFSSLRAVELASQHPGKMWRLHAGEMVSLLPQPASQPWHDSQYPVLPPVYVQNASLEISLTETIKRTGTISGDRVLPFTTGDSEGFDINNETDWILAELLVGSNRARLPVVPITLDD